MAFLLGIDTGGTYTDCALLDEQHNVVASCKNLTTRHDLTEGIANGLNALPADKLSQVALVSLSTTLTTNSVVEGRGSPVCVLLAGYDQKQVQKSGLLDIVDSEAIIMLAGEHNANGQERHELDEDSARIAIENLKHKVSAFAISGMFGTRNPRHEIRLRELVRELTGKPVTCGHELASSLGAPRRALTVALNARLVRHTQQLIEAVEGILASRNIKAPLMMVQGDGSLINAETALRRPVGTVLSGPAASIVGAVNLSGSRDALVADMGGTTTDIAIVRNGLPELSLDGAMIGNWQPMVEALRVYSIGLGGDSEVRFSGGEGMVIGPRRVVPLSLAAHQFPEVLEALRHQLRDSPNPRQNRFVLRLDSNEVVIDALAEDEKVAWEALADHPLSMDELTNSNRPLARSLARLERKGVAIYTGFTPSDAAHVLGTANHWSAEAAEFGAQIWARQMRHIYGYGEWKEGEVLTICEDVVNRVVELTAETLIEAGLHSHGKLASARANKLAPLLAQLITGAGSGQNTDPLFKLEFCADLPLVAVGAPAASYYPGVAERLGIELRLPPHAEVANAVGAVLGSVMQQVHITIIEPSRGSFRVHATEGPKDFTDLESSVAWAEELASAEAHLRAVNAGADEIEVKLSRWENRVDHDIDGAVFFECVITASAVGRPRFAGMEAPEHALS